MKKESEFWQKVNKSIEPDGCWEWTGLLTPYGYGQVRWKGVNQRTHRVSWQITNGSIPKGVFALHRCDNRKCVRPSHLWLGSAKDNMQDAAAKGKMGRHARSLSAEIVIEIKKSLAEGENIRSISNRLSIPYDPLIGISHGKTYKDIGCAIPPRAKARKLPKEKVAEMLSEYQPWNRKVSQRKIAAKYGITHTVMGDYYRRSMQTEEEKADAKKKKVAAR